VATGFAYRWLHPLWVRRRQAARESKARNWPTLTATIEVPTVAGGLISGKAHFLATLTYFYRNPQLQMGEYKRIFSTKAKARA
jgi:hypothetical protein